jgi:hypothetical protein
LYEIFTISNFQILKQKEDVTKIQLKTQVDVSSERINTLETTIAAQTILDILKKEEASIVKKQKKPKNDKAFRFLYNEDESSLAIESLEGTTYAPKFKFYKQ